jgi:hypothetical protein
MGGKLYTNKELLCQFKSKYPENYNKKKYENIYENLSACDKCSSNIYTSKVIYMKSRVSPLFEFKLNIMGEIGEEGPPLYCRKCSNYFKINL